MKNKVIYYILSPPYKGLVFYRVLAVILGGYVLTLISSMFLSQVLDILGMDRVNASVTAMLLSFSIYVGIAIWFFATKSVKKVWLNLLVSIAVLGSLVWLIRYWSLL